MSTETQKVDVLAVMRHSVSALHGAADKGAVLRRYADSLHEAKEAVAELIERDKDQREALETCGSWFAMHSPTAPVINGMGNAEHPMLTMIRAALARVGGPA